MNTTPRTVSEITEELRAHPEVTAVVVWVEEDATAVDIDPDAVSWSAVEEVSVERGWEVIHQTGLNS